MVSVQLTVDRVYLAPTSHTHFFLFVLVVLSRACTLAVRVLIIFYDQMYIIMLNGLIGLS